MQTFAGSRAGPRSESGTSRVNRCWKHEALLRWTVTSHLYHR